jgi:hypothetical protein
MARTLGAGRAAGASRARPASGRATGPIGDAYGRGMATEDPATDRFASPGRRNRPPGGRLAWLALLLAPALYLVEVEGPRWLNLALRAVWVALVVTVLICAARPVWQRGRSPDPAGRQTGR